MRFMVEVQGVHKRKQTSKDHIYDGENEQKVEEPGLELSSSVYSVLLSTVTFCGFPVHLVVALMLEILPKKMERACGYIAGDPGRVLILRLLR